MSWKAAKTWCRLRGALCVALALLFCGATRAEPELGGLAAIVARVLSYERTLPTRAGGRVDVVILYLPGLAASEHEASDLNAGFRALSGTTIQGLVLRSEQLAYSEQALLKALAAGADVVLVCTGLEQALTRVAAQARQHGVLTIGLRREHAKVATSLAVVVEEGRPRIIANLTHANAEKVQLSAQLLRRAEML